MAQKKDISNLKKTSRAVVAGLGTVAALALAGPAGAAEGRDEVAHFIECFGWMLTEPVTHAEQCGPNTIPDSLKSLSTTTVSPPLAPVVSPEPEEEEPGHSGPSGHSGPGPTGT